MGSWALENEIVELIERKAEGSYWDFKKEWHSNNADLLHDIICMANSTVQLDKVKGVMSCINPHMVKNVYWMAWNVLLENYETVMRRRKELMQSG